jgi:ferritin-like metal-binding protein YciE
MLPLSSAWTRHFQFRLKLYRRRPPSLAKPRAIVRKAIPKTMKLNTLKDLYLHELKDLYSAEKQIIKALPKMIKTAANQELAAGFKEHLEQTREHAERLEKILSGYDQTTRGPKCKGMEGLLAEGSEMMEEEADDEVRDAGLIAAAQRVEHYEISGYGTARTYASLLGDKEGAELLQTTLDEEAETDKKLTGACAEVHR